ncbi:hypothetical protein AWL63_24130 (plasmid) [Sphingomonas panacis]|uniref:Uncharacterized protein n=1 Tax=Sphingomonas panacis TaxID=1560345 RepID=A0A1B3ZIK2_9SPHN|nr:hypothetical protein [Sphingomonas panacis]AOH87246.1 hypothetical protein AWL63_24130 [Sphingomonas panacis]
MSADTRNFVLDISTDFFKLSTESLRLHSNETHRFETLESLINARAASGSYKDEHKTDTLRKHLCAIPTEGDIRITLTIRKTSAESLDEARARLCGRLGSDITVADAISVLLFDYVAEKRAGQLLDRIGLGDSTQNGDKTSASGEQDGNVIPLR